mmetsp:Transcript_13189/g.27905  ORF Transcript_13189/g.27905 Transcript_13189/m.27905 type:complete len:262 (-) Transcript_13189:905-1690(-)
MHHGPIGVGLNPPSTPAIAPESSAIHRPIWPCHLPVSVLEPLGVLAVVFLSGRPGMQSVSRLGTLLPSTHKLLSGRPGVSSQTIVRAVFELAREDRAVRPYHPPLTMGFVEQPFSVVGASVPQHYSVPFLEAVAKLTPVLDAVGSNKCSESVFFAVRIVAIVYCSIRTRGDTLSFFFPHAGVPVEHRSVGPTEVHLPVQVAVLPSSRDCSAIFPNVCPPSVSAIILPFSAVRLSIGPLVRSQSVAFTVSDASLVNLVVTKP